MLFNAHHELMRLDGLRSPKVQLDPVLQRYWETHACNPNALRRCAEEFHTEHKKRKQAFFGEYLHTSSGRDNQAKRDLKKAMGETLPQMKKFYDDERARAREEFDTEGFAFEIFALALYMAKYEDLSKNEETDECVFPWYIVNDELCSIKRGTVSGEEMRNRLLVNVLVQNNELRREKHTNTIMPPATSILNHPTSSSSLPFPAIIHHDSSFIRYQPQIIIHHHLSPSIILCRSSCDTA